MAQRVPAAPPIQCPLCERLTSPRTCVDAEKPTGAWLLAGPHRLPAGVLAPLRTACDPAPHPAVASPAACDSFRAFGSWKEDLSVRRSAEGPSALVCLMVIAHARSRGALAVWRAGRGGGVPSHHSL